MQLKADSQDEVEGNAEIMMNSKSLKLDYFVKV